MKDWRKVKLGTLLTESKIVSENPDTNKRLRVRLNMLGVEKRPNTNDKEGATKYYIRKTGQFIYGKQNLHKGAFGIIPHELDGFESSSDIPAFDVDESCHPEWIYYFFKKGNFYLDLEKLAKGVGSKRIQPTQIFDLDIYLPSKDEQKRILEEILDIESKYTNILVEIENQKNWIFELRQSVLDKAIRGGLTEKWRKTNLPIESAHKLLDRIMADKERLIKEKKIKNEKNIRPVSTDKIPFEVPDTWTWTRLGNVIEDMVYGTSQKTDDNKNNVPVLRMGNVTSDGKLNFDNLKYISPDHSDLPKLFLKTDDIVFNRTNSYELVGKSAVFEESDNKYTLASYLIKVTPLKKFLNSFYLNNYIISPTCRKTQIEPQIISQTNQANFSGHKLKNILFPLPPMKEQDKIVHKVNEFMEVISKLDFEIQASKQYSEQFIQGILIKLLGDEKNEFLNIKIEKKKNISYLREKKYDSKTTLMELIDLLKEHGKLHAEDLWKMSKHFDNKNIGDSIDKFYADLKEKIEVDKAIKEVENEKGYLELV